MPVHSPFRLLHRLRADEAADILRYSSRLTLALAMLDEADPAPVALADFTRAFACAPPETAGVLARLRSLGLAERSPDAPGSYRLAPEGRATKDRIAALLASGTPTTTAA
jgi:hypothetical protein